MAVGFGKWVVGKALKEGPKVIKAIKPLVKIDGAKSVLDVKNLASAARAKAASFGYKEGIKKGNEKNEGY